MTLAFRSGRSARSFSGRRTAVIAKGDRAAGRRVDSGELMGVQIRPSRRSAGEQLGGLPPTSGPALPAWVAEFSVFPFRHVTTEFDGVCGMDILTFQQHVFEAYQ